MQENIFLANAIHQPAILRNNLPLRCSVNRSYSFMFSLLSPGSLLVSSPVRSGMELQLLFYYLDTNGIFLDIYMTACILKIYRYIFIYLRQSGAKSGRQADNGEQSYVCTSSKSASPNVTLAIKTVTSSGLPPATNGYNYTVILITAI